MNSAVLLFAIDVDTIIGMLSPISIVKAVLSSVLLNFLMKSRINSILHLLPWFGEISIWNSSSRFADRNFGSKSWRSYFDPYSFSRLIISPSAVNNSDLELSADFCGIISIYCERLSARLKTFFRSVPGSVTSEFKSISGSSGGDRTLAEVVVNYIEPVSNQPAVRPIVFLETNLCFLIQ